MDNGQFSVKIAEVAALSKRYKAAVEASAIARKDEHAARESYYAAMAELDAAMRDAVDAEETRMGSQ